MNDVNIAYRMKNRVGPKFVSIWLDIKPKLVPESAKWTFANFERMDLVPI